MATHARPEESREAQAAREVGRTEVSRGVAALLVAAFAMVVGGIGAFELVRDLSQAGSPWADLAAAPARAWSAALRSGPVAGNRALLEAMHGFEDRLDERSAVAERVLPPVQRFLTESLDAGNEQVVVGRRGWLYFRPALDHVTGPPFLDPARLRRRAEGGESWEPRPQPDPLRALADFHAQLAHRGIGLVVVVTPVKASIHPEGLAPSLGDGALPLENPSLRPFLERLEELEIPAYDPAARLAAALAERGWPQFLRTDTHWTPQAMESAAEGLAAFLRRHARLPERAPLVLTRGNGWVEGRGDVAALLKLDDPDSLFPPERVPVRPVRGSDGATWRPDPDADVLVLGDSFTNVYSQPELGWGEGAGFAEQLAFFLQRPVDRVAVNAGGPSAARERLAAALASGDDRLAGKRLVVYQFTARELSVGDWRPVNAIGDPGVSLRRPEEPLPARGLVTWESNRSGAWRIWTRRLEGSPARQLSPDEPGRQHCCAHLSPDGSKLAYLSRVVPDDEYPELEVAGELRLVDLVAGSERTLVPEARPYGWGNRAALWNDDAHLAFIGADGRSLQIDVTSGRVEALTDEPRRRLAWLVDPGARLAVDGSPSFSVYDPDAHRVIPAERRPGCEPYFTHDRRFGFWVRGGGGPVRWLDLASGEVGTLLEHEDRRIPGAQRYAYFPMVSRDGSLLAFGASPGDHDHFWSNYDVFVAPLDGLTLAGRPQRLTAHPASDRYPDVHVESLDLEAWRRDAPPEPLGEVSIAPAASPFVARASLVACSRVPSLREISPYDAALIVCEWRVEEVTSGEAPGETIRVAHWAIRGGERQPIASLAPGSTRSLDLEPLVGVSQIEGYPVFDTLPDAPDRPLLHPR